jgi:hypothetical protein
VASARLAGFGAVSAADAFVTISMTANAIAVFRRATVIGVSCSDLPFRI